MIEFIQFAFSPANAIFSMLLCISFLYWIIAALGMLDLDWLEFDFDVDVEGEVDAGVSGDMGGAFQSFLAFFYVGQVPMVILLSLLIFSMWAIAMFVNSKINPTGGMTLGLPVAVGSFVAGVFSLKFMGWPFGKLFAILNSNPNELKDVVGKICVVTTTQVSAKRGQAEVKTKGAPILINCIAEGGQVLKKHDEAVVLQRNKKGIYTIAPVNLESGNE